MMFEHDESYEIFNIQKLKDRKHTRKLYKSINRVFICEDGF